MVPDDLFVAGSGPAAGRERLNTGLLRSVREGTFEGATDLEAAFALIGLLRAEYVQFGTEGNQSLSNDDVRHLQRTARAAVKRLGLDLDVPWRDFSSFKDYWVNNGGHGSWQARRDMVAAVFDPVQDQLEALEDAEVTGGLARPVTSHSALGWPAVDAEIEQVRRAFHRARSPIEHREVGLACVGVLEALSAVVYDADRHLYEGEEVPPVSKTKLRLTRVVEHESAAGEVSKELSRLVKRAIELSEAVKHSPNRSRAEAGIAADTVILLTNMLRRLAPSGAVDRAA